MSFRSFAITKPVLGIKQDTPSILVRDAYFPDTLDDIQNVMFRYDEIHRCKMRSKEWTAALPDQVLHYDQYWQKDLDWWLLVCTKRDIAYRDAANDRLVYITPQYATGTASFTNGSTTVVGAGGADFTELKAGDFITIGATYSTDDTWYEIDSITDGTHLELTAAYAEANSGAVAYKARVTYTGTNTSYWESKTFNNRWIATNGVEALQVWAGTGQAADLAGSPPIAKHIAVYENYVVLGNLSATNEPYTYAWCAIGDEEEWSGGDSGSAEIDDYYVINGFAQIHGFLILLTERTLEKLWLIGGDLVFNRQRVTSDVGCWAPQSIVEITGAIYFYSADNTYRCYTGLTWESVSGEIDKFMKQLHPTYEIYMQATYAEEYNVILLAVPDNSSTGRNNKVLLYDLNAPLSNDNWTIKNMEVCAFGFYEMESQMTWASLTEATWFDWAWDVWQSRREREGAPHDLCSDYSGYTYRLFSTELDNGSDFTGSFVLKTDLSTKGSLIHLKKRVTQFQVIFRNEGAGTVNLYAKRDFESSWQSIGSVALDADTNDFLYIDVNCDMIGKVFLLKFSATNRFRFIGVIFPEFEILGAR